jgi:cytidylate kinase
MQPIPIIAIDGPSAGGKGTIARGIARELNFAHLETGLLYRYVARLWLAREKDNLDLATEIALELAKNFHLSLLDDPLLRSNEVAEAASITSAHPPVRAALLELQRDFANDPGKFLPSPTPLLSSIRGAILDGRDIASVVCPDAAVKLFVTASPEIRAERRRKELQSYGQIVTYEQVLAQVQARDLRDTTRETAPLKPTAGSVEIDTSNLSAEDATGVALRVIRRILPNI